MQWFLLHLMIFSSTIAGRSNELEMTAVSNGTTRLRSDVGRLSDPEQLNKTPWIDELIGSYPSNEQKWFGKRSEYTKKQLNVTASDDNIFCRAPDGRYLPSDIFALDTCARCYQYIPDNPTFFHHNSKWNHTIVRARSLFIENDIWFNVSFLTHGLLNETVSAFFKFVLHPVRKKNLYENLQQMALHGIKIRNCWCLYTNSYLQMG